MKHILIILAVLSCLSGKSQTGAVRLEFEAAANSDIYKLIPLEEKGFLLFFETTDFADEKSKNWLFSLYDTSFTEAWKANVPVLEGAGYEDHFLKDSMLYLFFMNEGKVKSGSENFHIMTINLASGLSFETRGILPSESGLIKFRISGSRAFAGLNLKNDQAAVYSIDLKTASVNVFNVTYPDQNFIEDLVFDHDNDQLLVAVCNYLERRQNKLYLLVLTPDAGFRYDVAINPEVTGKVLNTARIWITDSLHYMLIGNYGKVATKIPGQNEYFGIESTGVFTCGISGQAQLYMNYYNFMDFNNLRAGVSARDFYRLQKKKERESPEYSMNYELLTHDPEMHDSTVVIMMEAFYPEFRTVSDISYDYWGRPVTHTYTVFEGYRFFNAILTGFSPEGELVWDNSLEMNTYPTELLDRRVAYFFDGRPAILFYNDGIRISYRICLENTELETFSTLDLATTETGDRISATGRNWMLPWYGYKFLAFGYHTVRNNLIAGKNERTVFYINKIALE